MDRFVSGTRHCEEQGDEAIQSLLRTKISGLLRFARNDGKDVAIACHLTGFQAHKVIFLSCQLAAPARRCCRKFRLRRRANHLH
jgi:hypothetical protein